MAVVIEEVVFALSAEIEKEGLDVELVVPPGIEMATDRRRLVQCVFNYLSNAVKYTEMGRVGITARETAGQVIVSVKDTGIGSREEDIESLFNSFVRLDTPPEGTGRRYGTWAVFDQENHRGDTAGHCVR